MGSLLLADLPCIGIDEQWRVVHGAEIAVAVEELLPAMSRAALYTIKPQYLYESKFVAHRLTLVHGPDNKLLAFAFVNLEAHDMLDVTAWSGTERLSVWSESLKDSGIRSAALKKAKILQHVGHLGAIACSPLARKGLGARLLQFQKCVAYEMLRSGPRPFDGAYLLALEAIKPLDLLYYGPQGFQTTSNAFWSTTDSVGLAPMMCKLGPDHMCAALAGLAPVGPSRLVDRGPVEGIHQLAVTAEKVVVFLWRTKDHCDAGEVLRQIVVRCKLTIVEARKLWSMRHHVLSYSKGALDPAIVRAECPAQEDWFESCKVRLDSKSMNLLRRLC